MGQVQAVTSSGASGVGQWFRTRAVVLLLAALLGGFALPELDYPPDQAGAGDRMGYLGSIGRLDRHFGVSCRRGGIAGVQVECHQ